jgi:4-amino-4-deoxy-L-arabinose transferase-like glycosyltransferase
MTRQGETRFFQKNGFLEIVLLGLVLAVAAFYRLDVAPLDAVPPGLFSDEAHYGLDALAVLDGHHAIFFPNNGGREPLFIYLVAGSIALFGRTVAALRLPSALAGVATVGLTFLLVREMFRRSLGRPAALALATLAGLFLAVSQWHITFSRIAFRASTTPLLEVLAFWLFWRGLNAHAEGRRTAIWFALSGAALGGCLYTYLAGRFIPLVLVVFIILWALLRLLPRVSASLRPRVPASSLPWCDLALLVLVAVVVFAPLGAYFALHPDDFLHRAGEASVFNPAWNAGNPLGAFADSAVKAVGMLFWAGDPNWRHNIAGQPILNIGTAMIFLLGLWLALWNIRQAPCLFCVVWLIVMMLPSALTAEGIPNSLRNVAAAPVVYIFLALFFVRSWIELYPRTPLRASRFTDHVARFTLIALTPFMLASIVGGNYVAYFITWANHPETAKAMNADMHVVEIAGYMNAHADKETAFLLLNTYEHPGIAFLYTGQSPYASLPAGGDVPATMAKLCQGRSRLTVIRWDWFDPQATTAETFALGLLDRYAVWLGDDTNPGFHAVTYALPLFAGFPAGLSERDAQFGQVVRLTGFLCHLDIVAPGEDAWVALRWHLSGEAGHLLGEGDTPPMLKVTLRLLDAGGRGVAQLDKALTGPESDHGEAQPGDDLTDYYRLSIPPGTPPGTYTLVVGVYPPETMQLLPVMGSPHTDNLLTLGTIIIQ